MATVNFVTQTRQGRCPTHGDVEAEKAIPQFKPPFVIVFLVRRLLAVFAAYHCPMCGAKAS